ncbi:response regulator transcription factor [Brevibacillus fulvus]|uniref:Two-component system response regulator CssR n=1 Tax=Brevibacillus fulvus TaxID=1125967 RepID=A0A939BTJ4_9BACL|nr:response regulator transcription factor [Brevibacillus fulvus]MBM7589534.1 two-component system response regulator CssR [Brevibacillus fulvus]
MNALPYQVYLVDDETNLLELLKSYLQNAGYEVRAFQNGTEVLPVLEEQPPHLWILDIMLPDIDGYELLRLIRSKSDVPIIFISARDQDMDKIIGLELGSDDYLAKPFLPRELVIRVQKLLQRTYEKSGNPVVSPSTGFQDWVQAGPYSISAKGRLVKEGETEIELTTKEFELICYFLQNQGIALHREQILTAIWGDDYIGSDRAVDDLVKRIRKKMPKFPVETVYGFGYRMTQP